MCANHRDASRLFWSPDDHDLDFNGAVAEPAVVEEAFAVWKAQIAADEWLDGEIDLGAVAAVVHRSPAMSPGLDVRPVVPVGGKYLPHR